MASLVTISESDEPNDWVDKISGHALSMAGFVSGQTVDTGTVSPY